MDPFLENCTEVTRTTSIQKHYEDQANFDMDISKYTLTEPLNFRQQVWAYVWLMEAEGGAGIPTMEA